jgi:hypothetical protein
MKKPAILFVFFLILFCQLLVAQPANVIMPPPSVTSLGKFTEIPVDIANGLPNISVPVLFPHHATEKK